MPSPAEERIREKVVRMMRTRWPAGRIIHELQCGQGEHRLDVACVTTDRLILAEVKSERDVIKRAEAQLRKATKVADEVWLCISEKHLAALEEAKDHWRTSADPLEEWRHVNFWYSVKVLVERSKEPLFDLTPTWKVHDEARFEMMAPVSHTRFDLLWAAEMRSAIGIFFGGATLPGSEKALDRGKMTRLAVEHMSGREIRRAVCQQLRARDFPRADPPVPIEESLA